MLSHKILYRGNIDDTVGYYSDGKDDYYASEGSSTAWAGKGAGVLKLKGDVDAGRFRELLEGEVKPGEKVRASTRRDSEERLAVDFTFAAPKSVSMQALIGGDAAIIRAHDMAVAKAVEAAETLAQARQKVGAKSRIQDTGNLVVATFRHETSREQDPQLHTHAVVMNVTRRKDGKWRALVNDKLIAATRTHYLDAVYLAELAKQLKELGYTLRHERDGQFELAHIGRAEIEAFSQRSAQMDAWLAEHGLSRETATAAERQQAAYQTRPKKVSIEREELFKAWSGRANELGMDFSRREWAGLEHAAGHDGGRVPKGGTVTAKGAVQFAIKHISERQAVMEHNELHTVALRHATGHALLADIEREVKALVRKGTLIRDDDCFRSADGARQQAGAPRQVWIERVVEAGLKREAGLDREAARERVDAAIENGELVRADPRYTTQIALEHERQVLKFESEGRGKNQPVLPAERVSERLAGEKLTDGQRAAVELILSTGNRVVGVQGFAGTGKSHMLKIVKTMLEEQGYQMQTLASYRSQVASLRELGVRARTIEGFGEAWKKDIYADTVLIVDEASVVASRSMKKTLEIARGENTRVVLVGDTAQTPAIEAGRPFHQLQTQGMATAHMREIQRQKTPELRHAVELAAIGKMADALTWLRPIGVKDDGDRRARIAQDYARLTGEERDKTLIVSGTNEARRAINDAVREELGLAGKGATFDTLNRRDTTQAERRHAKYYRIGDAIQSEKDTKDGRKRGALYTIRDIGPGNLLTVEGPGGEKIAFTPRGGRGVSVYEKRRLEFVVGDVLRVTRNEGLPDFATGQRLKVADVTAQAITLTDGKEKLVLPAAKPLHLDYAYAMTAHSSQSMTVDLVLVELFTRSRTTAKDTSYVAASRARYAARIYTDDLHRLPKAVMRENEKTSALDLARKGRADGYRRQMRRGNEDRDMVAEAQHQAQSPGVSRDAPHKGGDGKERTGGGQEKARGGDGGREHGGGRR